MIVDVLELPFRGSVMPKYGAIIPVVLSQPHAPDDVYLLGYETTAPIHNKLFRYKIIEHIGGDVFEHIAITAFKLNLHTRNLKDGRPIFIVTTRHHHSNGISTYRYIKTIEQLLQLLNVNGANSVRTVHQMAINALNQAYAERHRISEMEIFLSQYTEPRHSRLTQLTTASISNAIEVMKNIREIGSSLDTMLGDRTLDTREINTWLDTNLCLPEAPPFIGLCSQLMLLKHIPITIKDIVSKIDKTSFGMYSKTISLEPLFAIDKLNDINSHLKEDINQLDDNILLTALNNTILLEMLTEIELCNYTDLSIEFKYSTIFMPDMQIHYSGSIFNHYSVFKGSTNINLSFDVRTLYEVLQLYYGDDRFQEDKPTIQICKTFGEEIYVKFITKDGKEWVDYFDLTILAILSPVVLDTTAEQYIWRHMRNGYE